MKRFYVAVCSCVVALLAQVSVADTVKIKVDGMVCGFCASSIEKRMRANAATADVFVSLADKIVAVSEKSGQKLDEAALKLQIADSGYEVKAIERVKATIDDVRAEVKAKKS
jgi:periplasmic mercuric ion binding protein